MVFQAPLPEVYEPPAQVEAEIEVEVEVEPQQQTLTEATRPTTHNGVKVVREQTTANLPNGATFRISKLHLVDGSLAYACRDCLFTADKRTQVQLHRNSEHGAKFGRKPAKVTFPRDRDVDFVLPPRENGPGPIDPMKMTLTEILSLMPTLAATVDALEHVEYERDAAIAELKFQRANKHKIDVYEALQDEVVELRLKMRETGSYEEMRIEVLALRAWKKNMIKRLSGLGFNFTDEEQQ